MTGFLSDRRKSLWEQAPDSTLMVFTTPPTERPALPARQRQKLPSARQQEDEERFNGKEMMNNFSYDLVRGHELLHTVCRIIIHQFLIAARIS